MLPYRRSFRSAIVNRTIGIWNGHLKDTVHKIKLGSNSSPVLLVIFRSQRQTKKANRR